MLCRARKLGDYLAVGVSTDNLNYKKKDRYPIYSEKERLEIIKGLRAVDEVFYEHSLEKKRQYVLDYKADVLVMGEDWQGQFDDLSDVCEVVYLPRTPAISTTAIIEKITS
jgi:glycerol-3-phosphate cytidylyltransferase